MEWSSGMGELNVGRGIGITGDPHFHGALSQFQHLEAAKSTNYIIGNHHL
jgi:hypothetical protein